MLFYRTPTANAAYFDVGLSLLLFGLIFWLLGVSIRHIRTLNHHLTPQSFYIVVQDLFVPSLWGSTPVMGVLAFLWYRFLALLHYVNALDVGAIGFTAICGAVSLVLVYFAVLLSLCVIRGQQLFPAAPPPNKGAV